MERLKEEEGLRLVLVTGEGKEASCALARRVGLLTQKKGEEQEEEEEEEEEEERKKVLCAPALRGPLLSLAMAENEEVVVVCRATPQDRVRASSHIHPLTHLSIFTSSTNPPTSHPPTHPPTSSQYRSQSFKPWTTKAIG